jgi:hypothetical protein
MHATERGSAGGAGCGCKVQGRRFDDVLGTASHVSANPLQPCGSNAHASSLAIFQKLLFHKKA